VGKSTLLRYLVNRILCSRDVGARGVVVLDFDPGQAEFTPPGCVAVSLIKAPLLGPNYTHLQEPERFASQSSSDSLTSRCRNFCDKNSSDYNAPLTALLTSFKRELQALSIGKLQENFSRNSLNMLRKLINGNVFQGYLHRRDQRDTVSWKIHGSCSLYHTVLARVSTSS